MIDLNSNKEYDIKSLKDTDMSSILNDVGQFHIDYEVKKQLVGLKKGLTQRLSEKSQENNRHKDCIDDKTRNGY